MRILEIEELEIVSGGIQWEGQPLSDNMIDCRSGTCVPYYPPVPVGRDGGEE